MNSLARHRLRRREEILPLIERRAPERWIPGGPRREAQRPEPRQNTLDLGEEDACQTRLLRGWRVRCRFQCECQRQPVCLPGVRAGMLEDRQRIIYRLPLGKRE